MNESTKTLHIEGMTCKNCVKHVEEALNALDGVQRASVDLDLKQATVAFSPELTNESLIEEAVRQAGYEVVEPEAKKPKTGGCGCGD